MTAFVWLIKRPARLRLPALFGEPLFIWFIFAVLYSIPGIFIDWRIGAAVLILRLLPVYLCLFAYRILKKPEDLLTLIRPLTILPIILLPFGIISLISGNQALPEFLRPIKELKEIHADYRAGFDMCSTVFATAPIMANTISALFYLTFACYTMPGRLLSRNDKIIFLISILADLILVFASTRRGDFFLVLAGVILFIYLQKRINLRAFVFLLFGLSVMFFLNNHSASPKSGFKVDKRSDFMFSNSNEINDRVNGIFIESLIRCAQFTPFGTYYGRVGRESAFAGDQSSLPEGWIETGGAQLIAETGIIGALLMPLMLIIVWVKLWKRSKNTEYEKSIKFIIFGAAGLFVLYYCKAIAVLSNLYMAQLYFWMAPGIALALCRKQNNSSAVFSGNINKN